MVTKLLIGNLHIQIIPQVDSHGIRASRTRQLCRICHNTVGLNDGGFRDADYKSHHSCHVLSVLTKRKKWR